MVHTLLPKKHVDLKTVMHRPLLVIQSTAISSNQCLLLCVPTRWWITCRCRRLRVQSSALCLMFCCLVPFFSPWPSPASCIPLFPWRRPWQPRSDWQSLPLCWNWFLSFCQFGKLDCLVKQHEKLLFKGVKSWRVWCTAHTDYENERSYINHMTTHVYISYKWLLVNLINAHFPCFYN